MSKYTTVAQGHAKSSWRLEYIRFARCHTIILSANVSSQPLWHHPNTTWLASAAVVPSSRTTQQRKKFIALVLLNQLRLIF
mmetsp:Transcript_265/g.486  ORF Transcript_265/g.486 Transcript_265/m.486 type:complete len:81 (-) Transcript_265:1092-1334(-)